MGDTHNELVLLAFDMAKEYKIVEQRDGTNKLSREFLGRFNKYCLDTNCFIPSIKKAVSDIAIYATSNECAVISYYVTTLVAEKSDIVKKELDDNVGDLKKLKSDNTVRDFIKSIKMKRMDR